MRVNMKKRERAESKKNKASVVKAIVKNPLWTQRERAKEAWVSKWTITNKLGELGQKGTKDDRIIGICDDDLKIVKLGQAELLKRLKDTPWKIWVRDIVSAMESWTKRYTIFKWDITDKEWGLKSIEWITINIDWWS